MKYNPPSGGPADVDITRWVVMKATEPLHYLGQSIWLDSISRQLLDTGTLARHIAEFSVTGLTSNPTIFDHAVKNSTAYDDGIDVDGLGLQLQNEGAAAFVTSWNELLSVLASKSRAVKHAVET